MGRSTSGRELAGKIFDLAAEMRTPTAALNRTGMAGKQIFLAQAAAAGVLGKRVAGKRKAIGARYDVGGGRRSSTGQGTVIVRYTGPAHLVNNPTQAHPILPRIRPGSRRRRGARALVINGNVRARVDRHPGTRGKRFYERARRICEQTLPKVFARAQLTEPLNKVFR